MESVGVEMMDLSFYKGKKVLITGHTGFKGSWLSYVLARSGAVVVGYSLEPPTEPSLFEIADIETLVTNNIGDIRDLEHLKKVFLKESPEIVFHLAAQPIVRTSYEDPVYTYETNVMGTVNLLECCRLVDSVKSVVNVTTDKVYKNNEWEWGYRENEMLDGYEPYSNSKSCSELVTASYKRSFLDAQGIAVSTARAGNVIGGGDFSKDRIIPDCFRAASKGEAINVRNPYSTRPYQHVLEPLFAYLLIAERQCSNPEMSNSFNVGPDEIDCVTTGQLTDLFCSCWGSITWNKNDKKEVFHEANFLKLDNSKIKQAFNWKPTWHVEQMMELTVRWYKAFLNHEDIRAEMNEQIERFIHDNNN